MKNYLQKLPFIIALLMFLALAAIFFFTYKQIYRNNEKAELANTELETEINERAKVKLLNSSINEIKAKRELLLKHFAQSSDIVPFLDTIEGLAPKVGVKAEIASVDVLKDKTGLVVRMNIDGTFENVYKFLTLLENSPYELEIVNIDMQKVASVTEVDEAGLPLPEKRSPSWRAVFNVKLVSFIP